MDTAEALLWFAIIGLEAVGVVFIATLFVVGF